MRAGFALASVWALAVACTFVEPVGDFEGPPRSPADAGSSGGAGGSAAAAGTTGSGGFPTVECQFASECDDGDACNGAEICAPGGKCAAGTPPELDDGNSCTVDFCDPKKGVVHEGGAGPAVKICASTAAPCPTGYYRRRTLICDPVCGTNCPFCVNGFSCEEACVAQVQVCCASDPCTKACPAGYSFVSELSTTDCGCATVAGPAAICQRG